MQRDRCDHLIPLYAATRPARSMAATKPGWSLVGLLDHLAPQQLVAVVGDEIAIGLAGEPDVAVDRAPRWNNAQTSRIA